MTATPARSLSPVRRALSCLVLPVALVGLTGVAPPAAHAAGDGVDDRFLAALKAKGIKFDSSQTAIINGHEVCDELDMGRQKPDIANDVVTNSGLTSYQAGFFVGVSVAAYCPRYLG